MKAELKEILKKSFVFAKPIELPIDGKRQIFQVGDAVPAIGAPNLWALEQRGYIEEAKAEKEKVKK